MIIVNCSICKKEIKTYPSIAKTKKYCSYQCKNIAYKGRKLSIKTRLKIKKHNAKYWLGKKRPEIKEYFHHKGKPAWNKGKKMPQISGKNHPNWTGGIRKAGRYIMIYFPSHPFAKRKCILEHRLVMEKYLGRYLKPNEVVHHKNGNGQDNRIKNLIVFKTNAQHLRFHLKK